MVDAVALLKAARMGYEFETDEMDNHWYRMGEQGPMHGPFRNIDEAAYAAIGQYETQLAFEMIDKHGVLK